MYTRNLERKLDALLAQFPVVIVVGVRQCGKSVLVKKLRPSWEYFDLERPSDHDLIMQDPELFFQNHPEHLILDEAQLVPEVMAVLRGVIDENRGQRNRFILTGSSSPELLRTSAETLAGRAAIVELAPLKVNETLNLPLPPFYSIFENRLTLESLDNISSLSPIASYHDVLTCWFNGGYPEVLMNNNSLFRSRWYENYIKTFVERDLKQLFPGIDSASYRRFIAILRDFHGNSMNVSDISRSLSLSEATIRKYLAIADSSYLWRVLRSYERTALRSIVKHPRGLYRDSGIFHFLTSLTNLNELETSRYRGSSFECFVIEELLRGLESAECFRVEASFFRTRAGAEIDLILSGSFGTLPIEIKCAKHTTKSDISSLIQFVEREEVPFGMVINFSEKPMLLQRNIIVVPVTYI